MADYYVKLPPTGGGSSGVTSIDSITGAITLVQGAGIVITDNSPLPGNITIGATNTGTVTSVSVVSANGFAGTVANPTTAAAITIDTTVTGILYGNGTAVAAAVPANFPTLNQNTSGTAANITATTNATLTSLTALTAANALTSASSLATVGTITSGVWNGTATMGQQFITSGTLFTTPANITANTIFTFNLVGGGGGGGGINTASAKGSGGGGGAAGRLYISGLSPSTSYSLTIGAGGSGGISTTTPATAGGSTTLTIGATTYTAAGGGAGADTIDSVGGAGGAATNFTINLSGHDGAASGAATADAPWGAGGDAGDGWGKGGAAVFGNVAGTPGNAGKNYGGGGSGSNGLASTGGAGAQGAINVVWNS